MQLPASAFAESYPSELAPGSIFRFRQNWCLRLAPGQSYGGGAFVILEGTRAGQWLPIEKGMARGLHLCPPFSWYPAVEWPAEATGGYWTASLVFSPQGPVVIAGRGEGQHLGYTLDGQPYEDDGYLFDGMTRAVKWTAELAAPEHPFQSLGTIFSVDRRS